MDEMLACGAKMVVAIVDACRNQQRIDYQSLAEHFYAAGVEDARKMGQDSGQLADSSSKTRFVSDTNSKSLGSQGKAILFATSHDTSALEYRDLPNGIFTHFFGYAMETIKDEIRRCGLCCDTSFSTEPT
jgi:hypothetical protein